MLSTDFLRIRRRVLNNTIKEIVKKLVGIIPTKMWLSWRFKKRVGYKMDWKKPKTFNQKIQWLKVYNKKQEYTQMVDKAEAKKYVASIIGEEYIVPTIGVFKKFDDINFDEMPQRFVIKCTHDSGGLVIVRDKASFDKAKAKKKIEKALKANPYTVDREWPYKNVKPRIIIEEYLEDIKTSELRDYKFFCFNGEVKALFIASDRYKEGEETKFDFFDTEYNHLPFTNGHPNGNDEPEKPQQFELMKELAKKLSQGIPHVRVDFYEVDGKVYFGELTFSHWSGMTAFEPIEWDYTFGEWIELPRK